MGSIDSTGSFPDFIIGGAPKCATTALFDYLAQHPSVFACDPKEPHYFASSPLGRTVMQGNYSKTEYRKLFTAKQEGQISGEGSTHYLHHGNVVAPYMASLIPDARLIFILRNPVSRAFSHYLFRYSVAGPYQAGGMGNRDTFATFANDSEIFAMGDYASNLEYYLKHYPREQIKVLLFEDVKSNSADILSQLCAFLGVSNDYEFDLSQRSNETVYAKHPALMPALDRLFTRIYRSLNHSQRIELLRLRREYLFGPRARKPKPDEAESNIVQELHRAGIERLESLIERDLSQWLGRD